MLAWSRPTFCEIQTFICAPNLAFPNPIAAFFFYNLFWPRRFALWLIQCGHVVAADGEPKSLTAHANRQNPAAACKLGGQCKNCVRRCLPPRTVQRLAACQRFHAFSTPALRMQPEAQFAHCGHTAICLVHNCNALRDRDVTIFHTRKSLWTAKLIKRAQRPKRLRRQISSANETLDSRPTQAVGSNPNNQLARQWLAPKLCQLHS